MLIYYSPHSGSVPDLVREFARDRGLALVQPATAQEVMHLVNRQLPACIVLEEPAEGADLCRKLKGDAFTAIVPVVFALRQDGDAVFDALEAGADEVLTPVMTPRERRLRLQGMLARVARDVSVHPTTRLPGTASIERDIGERTRRGEIFAVCYADLDHFKEFNDRYGYNSGDRVIRILSMILRDVVRSVAPTGFIGHIGGDDFIFNVPVEHMPECCEMVLEIFDTLIPYQYTEEHRRAGYFLGKDRRGRTFRVPLMTLSIGVVTNVRRRFVHTARVSELATEMKTYAKSLPGSVYAVDRRSDAPRPGRPLGPTKPEEPVEAVTESAP